MMKNGSDVAFEKAHAFTSKLVEGLSLVIRGKGKFLEYLLTGLIAGGHVLIEDVPGLGKTTVAKTLARLISTGKKGKVISFRRIQFTPDLLPYDITGVDIFDPDKKEFVFSPGPVFANIVLADEINRTTPKVQSALLEVMAENQVTIGNKTHKMDPLFFVIATQNPVEIEGTYALPLAQLDRFMLRLRLGYPDLETEYEIVRDDPVVKTLPGLEPVGGKADVLHARRTAYSLHCDEKLMRSAVLLASTTRASHDLALGVSPRGSLMLIDACKAYALVKGRDYVIDQDIIDLAPLVYTHRLRLKDIKLDPEDMIRKNALEITNRLRAHI
ncbi:MAG: AAA family ATPase [Spirochaetota bacterium]